MLATLRDCVFRKIHHPAGELRCFLEPVYLLILAIKLTPHRKKVRESSPSQVNDPLKGGVEIDDMSPLHWYGLAIFLTSSHPLPQSRYYLLTGLSV
jgi:hypothetical protein